MYVDPKVFEQDRNKQRMKDLVILTILMIFIVFEYQALHDLLVRLTHNLVVTETNEINYEPSGLGLWKSPTVVYQWKGMDYQRPVGGLLLANSASIIPPVRMLVDPENPQTAILKTPYGGWGAWTFDFLLLQALFGGFIYAAFIGPYRIRKKSYFH